MQLPKNSIKNPLTIIAMFAAIAEISGSGVLPFLENKNQSIFMWFVMVFPILLVILFFYTLNRKHHVLYAPSDYKSDDSFSKLALTIMPQTNTEQRDNKIQNVSEIDQDSKSEMINALIENPKVEYFLAEELALKRLEHKYGDMFLTQRAIEIDGNRFSVDGLIQTDQILEFFEIKYFPSKNTRLNGIGQTYKHFETISECIEKSDLNHLHIVFNIVIVSPIPYPNRQEVKLNIEQNFANKKLKVNFNYWDFEELKKEYGI